jgi:hypothetical protein
MTGLDWVVGALLLASALGVIGIVSNNGFLIDATGVVLGVGFFGLVWAWLASHKIFVLPGFILTKVRWRPRKD